MRGDVPTAILLCLMTILPAVSGSLPGAPAPRGPEDAAAALYGRADLRVAPLHEPAFAAAFPGLALYAAQEPVRHPMPTHAMAYDPASGAAFDLTRDANALLAHAGVLLLSEADALRAARAFATLLNADLQPERRVVGAADAASLGVPLADPAATRLVDGWEVRLSTWSRENGVLAAWTLRAGVSALQSAEWRVAALRVGHHEASEEATLFRVGTRVADRWSGEGVAVEAFQETADGLAPLRIGVPTPTLGHIPIAEGVNFDGSRWVVRHRGVLPGATPPEVQVLADALAAGGVEAYGDQVRGSHAACATGPNPAANWSFHANDSDCVLNVWILHADHLTCGACIEWTQNVDIYVNPLLYGSPTQAAANGETFDEFLARARKTMSHENFHNLQRVASGGSPFWNAYVEGQALFQETLSEPDASAEPDGGWYRFGANYLRTAHLGVCNTDWLEDVDAPQLRVRDRSYSGGLFWGYLYDTNGGVGTIHHLLRDLRNVSATAPCDAWLPVVVTRALQNATGLHDSHEALLADFALAIYEKDFTWGTPQGNNVTDWGQHLADPRFEEQGVGETATRTVGASGIQYVRLPASGPYAVGCTAGAGWTFRLLLDAAGTVTPQTVTCGTAASVSGAYTQVVLAAVRTGTTAASYDLSVS